MKHCECFGKIESTPLLNSSLYNQWYFNQNHNLTFCWAWQLRSATFFCLVGGHLLVLLFLHYPETSLRVEHRGQGIIDDVLII